MSFDVKHWSFQLKTSAIPTKYAKFRFISVTQEYIFSSTQLSSIPLCLEGRALACSYQCHKRSKFKKNYNYLKCTLTCHFT